MSKLAGSGIHACYASRFWLPISTIRQFVVFHQNESGIKLLAVDQVRERLYPKLNFVPGETNEARRDEDSSLSIGQSLFLPFVIQTETKLSYLLQKFLPLGGVGIAIDVLQICTVQFLWKPSSHIAKCQFERRLFAHEPTRAITRYRI